MFHSTESLRERQIARLNTMLGFNGQGEAPWKVLVLDSRSTQIVSSVLRVNDLLSQGVTMHALITQRRAPLGDVPAVYFVQPTFDNVALIIKDIESDQYSDFYINFTSSLNRSLLEDFAKRVASTGKAARIKQVWDQYIDFVVTEPNLFSLELANIYSAFNSPKTTEDEINSQVEVISQALFCQILTMGQIPILRANKNGPAELVAQRLDQKLRDHIINTRHKSHQQQQQQQQEKSVFILLDRHIDLASMFAHSWIYQCMVSDVFNLKRNTITIEGSTKRYDIDPKDFFWIANASLPFPDAVENVEFELSQYTQDAKDLTAQTGYTSIKDIDPTGEGDTKQIQEAIKALPELTHRKSIIDMHMSVLSELIKQLQTKSLDSFFEIEQNLNDKTIEQQFTNLLNGTGDALDKLRTYVILYLSKDLSKEYCDKCEAKLLELGCDLSSMKHIKNVKELTKMQLQLTSNAQDNAQSSAPSYLGSKTDLFSNISSKLLNLEGSSKITEGFGSLVKGLKSLLPASQHLPVTSITSSIMAPSQATNQWLNVTDDYAYFDPQLRGSGSKKAQRSEYYEATVMIIGGGNYLEYSNLQDWIKEINKGDVTKKRLVCYGSDMIVTPVAFLEQCSKV